MVEITNPPTFTNLRALSRPSRCEEKYGRKGILNLGEERRKKVPIKPSTASSRAKRLNSTYEEQTGSPDRACWRCGDHKYH